MSKSNTLLLKKIGQDYILIESERTKLQVKSNEVLRLSKQIIFALQRSDEKHAKDLLNQAEKSLLECKKLINNKSRLINDGSWRAALEEFLEARFFYQVIKSEPLSLPDNLSVDDPGILLGAISDLIGEMVRLAVRLVTSHEYSKIEGLHKIAEEFISFIISLDLTGNARSKGDQAKQHFRRFEDIRYDLSIRSR